MAARRHARVAAASGAAIAAGALSAALIAVAPPNVRWVPLIVASSMASAFLVTAFYDLCVASRRWTKVTGPTLVALVAWLAVSLLAPWMLLQDTSQADELAILNKLRPGMTTLRVSEILGAAPDTLKTAASGLTIAQFVRPDVYVQITYNNPNEVLSVGFWARTNRLKVEVDLGGMDIFLNRTVLSIGPPYAYQRAARSMGFCGANRAMFVQVFDQLPNALGAHGLALGQSIIRANGSVAFDFCSSEFRQCETVGPESSALNGSPLTSQHVDCIQSNELLSAALKEAVASVIVITMPTVSIVDDMLVPPDSAGRV